MLRILSDKSQPISRIANICYPLTGMPYLVNFPLWYQVNISLKKSGSRLEHQGVKIEFVGQIELYYDRGNHHEFTSLVKELARPGELTHNASFEFEFNQVEKPYESYAGTNVRLR